VGRGLEGKASGSVLPNPNPARPSNGVIFEIYFEKAHNKVRWDSLWQTLRMKGFTPLWCRWVQDCVNGGHVGVKVNDQKGS
ncbi:hypothetical protein U9M48_024221, partial [Paspalum notatum var. saurae]